MDPRIARRNASSHGFKPKPSSRSFVSIGAAKFELREKCGEPTSRETRAGPGSASAGEPAPQTTLVKRGTVTAERWIYDQGPHRFLRTVLFENGRIVDIQAGVSDSAAATDGGAVGIARCDPQSSFNLGHTPAAVIARCGEPTSREYRRIDVPSALPDGIAVSTVIEARAYNFGAQSFVRILHFHDGKPVEIINGNYGTGG